METESPVLFSTIYVVVFPIHVVRIYLCLHLPSDLLVDEALLDSIVMVGIKW